MESYFYLNPEVAVLPVEDGVILEASDGFQITREVAQVTILAALATSNQTFRQLADHLSGSVDQTDVHNSLNSLVGRGILEKGIGPLTPRQLGRWCEIGIDPSKACIAVSTYSVSISSRHQIGPAIHQNIEGWGFSLLDKPKSIQVVVDSDPLSDFVAVENKKAIESGSPWVLVAPECSNAWQTLFQPDRTACSECLAARLRHNRPSRSLASPIPREGLQILPSMADWIGSKIARFLASGEAPELENHWALCDGYTGRVQKAYPFDRLPHCSVCGEPVSNRPPLARSRFSQLDYRRLINPVTGIARDLRFLESIEGVSATVIRHRFFDKADSLDSLMQNEQHVAGGKGWNPEEAAISACGEAVERISGCFRDEVDTLEATATELGDEALFPNQVDLFSDFQLETPSNPEHRSTLTIPHRLDRDLSTRWVRAWPLGEGDKPVWYPAGAAFYGYPFEGARFALATSNGCAAGPSPQAAVVSGLLELIERDAAAIWWYNKIQQPSLDLESLADGRLHAVNKALHARQRSYSLLDVTTDLGIPVVVAVSRRSTGLPGWTLGFGAGFTHREAALRATGELAQLIAPTDSVVQKNPTAWVDTASTEDNPHLIAAGEHVAPTRALEAGLQTLVSALESVGLRAFVIDQMHSLVGVPVVRTLAPGLVHFWRRLGGARVYEVPIKMGWLEIAKTESEMNTLDLTL